jgi:hypothetical protein
MLTTVTNPLSPFITASLAEAVERVDITASLFRFNGYGVVLKG